MSEFANTEPTFKETYTFILNFIKVNQIYIMDEDLWWGRLCWVKLIVNILAATSHTAGVLERIGQGADLVQLSTDLSATLILWEAVLVYIQLCVNRKLIKNLIIHLESKWRTDDQLRLEMVVIKNESMTSFLRWIKILYKVLTAYIYLYMLPPLVYEGFKHLILKETIVFTAPFCTKMPFRTDDNFLLYFLVSLADFKIRMRFAQVQSRVCIIRLLSKFRVEASRNTVRSFSFNPYRGVLAPKDPLFINLFPREG